MSAEEFAAGACPRPDPRPCPPMPPMDGCGCGYGGAMPPVSPDCPADDCPADECGQDAYCRQMICCCRPAPAAPRPPQVEEGCCCKRSFRAALSLLCDPQISSLLDFDTAAFLTSTYSAGAVLEAPAPDPVTTPTDNLPAALAGSFRRFSPNNCDLIDVDAPVYNAAGTEVFTATQLSLCHLDAVAIQGAAAAAEGDLTAIEVTARNFRCMRSRLAQRLNPCGSPCSPDCRCSCACDSGDCCCAAGLLATLAQNNISRRVSLVAGLLVLTGVTLLGTVGNVLVLSNDTDNRLYFVCVNSVQFIG